MQVRRPNNAGVSGSDIFVDHDAVHPPEDESMQEAMDKKAAREVRRAQGGHKSGHTARNAESAVQPEEGAIN